MGFTWTLVFFVCFSVSFGFPSLDGECGIAAFADCYDDTMNISDIYEFYCNDGATEVIQCMEDNVNTECGPDTYNGVVQNSLTEYDPSEIEKLCRNESGEMDLMECIMKLSSLDSYMNCLLSGFDFTNFDLSNMCSLIEVSTGCVAKYVNLMCPAVLPLYLDEVGNTNYCDIDTGNLPQADSCDVMMKHACNEAYNPPQSLAGDLTGLDILPVMNLYLCSSMGTKYLQCLDKVDNYCQTSSGHYVSEHPLVLAALADCHK